MPSDTPTAAAVCLGVVTETAPFEQRVAIDPDCAAQLVAHGMRVVVEAGAGDRAGFADEDYRTAGASVLERRQIIAAADILAVVRTPDDALVQNLRDGQVLIGLLDPIARAQSLATLAAAGVTCLAFELLPRTLSRAQSMDALSSQASAAGYRAVIVAASRSSRYLPMMITAAGTAKPASVIVLGTGVAGLQAIATARRLGAVVTGYDVRTTSRSEVESLGARFLTPTVADAAATGGYARQTSAEESKRQQDELTRALADFDIVIATAKVPGRTPPVLVTAEAIAGMRRGSICVDLAAGDQGGNVVGSVVGETVVTDHGVTIVGGDLAWELADSASRMYARNVTALVRSIVIDGAVVIDPQDELVSAITVARDGHLLTPSVREAAGLDAHPSSIKEGARS